MRNRGKKKPFTCDGIKFPSQRVFAEYYGFSETMAAKVISGKVPLEKAQVCRTPNPDALHERQRARVQKDMAARICAHQGCNVVLSKMNKHGLCQRHALDPNTYNKALKKTNYTTDKQVFATVEKQLPGGMSSLAERGRLKARLARAGVI